MPRYACSLRLSTRELELVAAVLAAAVLAAAAGAPRAHAQLGTNDGQPLAVARGNFLATAAGPAAGLQLPAAAAFVPDNRMFFAAEVVGDQLSGGDVLWQVRRFLVSYRHVDHRAPEELDYDEDHYAFGVAGQKGRWVVGSDAAYYVNNVAGADDAFTYGVSVATRPHPRFSLAVRALHFNRPHYVGGRLERVIAPGFAFHVLDRRLTLAADLFFREDGSDDFALRYGFESELRAGFHLAGAVTTEGEFTAGFAYQPSKEQSGYGISGDLDGGPRHHLIHFGREDHPPSKPEPGRRVTRPRTPSSKPPGE
jgi:hypothetical protein